MNYVLLSADDNPSVYLVPDDVADNLRKYCIEFETKWLLESPDAIKYRVGDGVCFDEKDFIDYLNTWIYPDEPSVCVETLGWIVSEADIPDKYRHCEWFNF